MHLLHAEDVMIFLAATKENGRYMNHMFSTMEDTVGLRINQTKSQLFFSIGAEYKTDISTILQIPKKNVLVKYPDIPLTSDYIHAAHYVPLLHKISSKLEGWDSKLLTTTGRA